MKSITWPFTLSYLTTHCHVFAEIDRPCLTFAISGRDPTYFQKRKTHTKGRKQMIVETGSRSLVNSNRKDQNCTTRDDKSEIMQRKRRGEKVNVGIKPERGEGGGGGTLTRTWRGCSTKFSKTTPNSYQYGCSTGMFWLLKAANEMHGNK